MKYGKTQLIEKKMSVAAIRIVFTKAYPSNQTELLVRCHILVNKLFGIKFCSVMLGWLSVAVL